jgi:V/A-type H+-transporting ATPase subunit D
MRRRRVLAQVILDILQKELDELVLKLFELLHEWSSLKHHTRELLSEAYNLFTETQLIVGTKKLEELSWNIPDSFNIDLIETPLTITFRLHKTVFEAPRYSLLETSAKLDEALSKMDEVLNLLIELAEIESTIRKLSKAITKAKQRVNGIKYIVIPQIDNTIQFIETMLDEEEREDSVRVRLIQSKRKARA